MRKKTLLLVFLILLSFTSVAQEDNTVEEDEGVLSILPEVEVNSADTTNTTGEASNSQTSLFWIIFLGLTLIGVIIYSFEIDPIWMVAFIVISGLILLQLRIGVLPI